MGVHLVGPQTALSAEHKMCCQGHVSPQPVLSSAWRYERPRWASLPTCHRDTNTALASWSQPCRQQDAGAWLSNTQGGAHLHALAFWPAGPQPGQHSQPLQELQLLEANRLCVREGRDGVRNHCRQVEYVIAATHITSLQTSWAPAAQLWRPLSQPLILKAAVPDPMVHPGKASHQGCFTNPVGALCSLPRQAWDLAVDICLSQLPTIIEEGTAFRVSPHLRETPPQGTLCLHCRYLVLM